MEEKNDKALFFKMESKTKKYSSQVINKNIL